LALREEVMTNPAGRCFISYRRTRLEDATLLVKALHTHGIPTWQDVEDLPFENTEEHVRKVLADPNTSSAVLLISPDVEDSAFIRDIEVPCIARRLEQNDGFFLTAVPLGLSYEAAAGAVQSAVVAHDLAARNMHRVEQDSLDEQAAAEIAQKVLRQRLAAVHRSLPPSTPLQLVFYAFRDKKPPVIPGVALTFDWSAYFPRKDCSPDTWSRSLLPALQALVSAIGKYAPDRVIEASGQAVLPAATALGHAFSTTSNLRLRWKQRHHDISEQSWSFEVRREPSGFEAQLSHHDNNARDLAVLISVSQDVEAAFAQFRPNLPPLRGILRVKKPGQSSPFIRSPGEARDVADVVRQGLIDARATYGNLDTIHLFMAVPVGLAVLIGQNLNPFGKVQTYEHVPTNATGTYVPAALLEYPS
jgi:hypothetical protein